MSEITTESTFTVISTVDLEKDKTLVIKKIENPEWNEETTKKGVFFIEEKNRSKKGLTLTNVDCQKLSEILKKISDK